jgi:hypothetical protein
MVLGIGVLLVAADGAGDRGAAGRGGGCLGPAGPAPSLIVPTGCCCKHAQLTDGLKGLLMPY